MKYILYILGLFPVLAFSQNASTSSNTEVKNTITKTFSKPVVLAYQEKAMASIQDFYTYINFYQNAENNQLLEKEIDKSIQNLFLNNTILVKDFFTTNSNPISLTQLLAKCKENRVQMKVSNFNQNPPTSDNYFTFSYDVAIIYNGKTVQQTVSQKVYFFPGIKSFGEQQKNVWQLQLGEF